MSRVRPTLTLLLTLRSISIETSLILAPEDWLLQVMLVLGQSGKMVRHFFLSLLILGQPPIKNSTKFLRKNYCRNTE